MTDQDRIAELERVVASQAQTIAGLQQAIMDKQSRRAGPDIYCDGACSPNPGTGGWGFVVVAHGTEAHRQQGGPIPNTTNNRMEMTAVIEALAWAKAEGWDRVTIYSDSQLTVKLARGKWVPKKNRGLANRLTEEMAGIKARFRWVKGHNGNFWNERADKLAAEASGASQGRSGSSRKAKAKRRRRTANINKRESKRLGVSGAVYTRNFTSGQTFGPASPVRHIDPKEYEGAQ